METREAVAKSAYCKHHPVERQGQALGPLRGLRFAAKDLFDIEGRVACCGNPEWLRTHEPASADAPVIVKLLSAGASLTGTTIMDELAYSLAGSNAHYGAPLNTAAPGRVTGGSSSGSAALVTAALVDFALGTDTGGSVRVPASYCGLYGLRPTHDRIPLQGVTPLAPTFDTIGWFCREAKLLEAVASVLLELGTAPQPTKLLIAEDAFMQLDEASQQALRPAIERVTRTLGLPVEQTQIAPDGFEPCYWAFRRIQAREAWRCHGDWVTREKPFFGPGVRERFAAAQSLSEKAEHRDEDEATRASLGEHCAALLKDDALLLLPPAAGPPPPIDADPATLEDFRERTLRLTCLASLAGVPQLAMPAVEVDDAPLGLSLMAARGADELLLAAATALA